MPIVRHLAAMGTAFSLVVSAPTRDTALAASEAAVRAVEAAEGLLSTWREDTPLARLNAAAPGAATTVPAVLYALLKRAFEWEERTEGAFDPAIAPLVKAWGLRAGGRIPDTTELRHARTAADARLFIFEESSLRVSRSSGAAGIDEGAWGKGWALDRAAEAARAAGATDLVLDLGGQVLAWGAETPIDVAAPRNRSRIAATLRLKDASASTSGNSERGLVVNGRRVGHILDPRTGGPAADFGSVTVVAKDGLTADVLSTAFFVLGPRDGMALSDRLRAEGVAHETLFFLESEKARGPRVSMSPGMKRLAILPPKEERAGGADAPPLPSSRSKNFSEGVLP